MCVLSIVKQTGDAQRLCKVPAATSSKYKEPSWHVIGRFVELVLVIVDHDAIDFLVLALGHIYLCSSDPLVCQ